MLGLICGDYIGSAYERHNTNRYDFELFGVGSRLTDDSVMAVAVADAVLRQRPVAEALHDWCGRYPLAGYGPGMLAWLGGDATACASKGNGAAVRAAPLGWVHQDRKGCATAARVQARPTHASTIGTAGSKAVALAVRTARMHRSMGRIMLTVSTVSPSSILDYQEWVTRSRSGGKPGSVANESVPAAIASVLASCSWESAVRNAVALGGDSDSIAAIAGAVAEAYYGGVPEEVSDHVLYTMPYDMLAVLALFHKDYVARK
jgi:ADP-ribosylglycohydrolase